MILPIYDNETLDEYEERFKRYNSSSETPFEDALDNDFLKFSPQERQEFLMKFHRLVENEAGAFHKRQPTRDYARWVTLRREFADRDAALRRAGR